MSRNPYERFVQAELILRDELAIDRTILANERTLLAYLRSAVALLIAGVSIIHFASERWFYLVGIVCIPFAFLSGFIGLYRYRKMNQAISVVRNRLKKETAEAGRARASEGGDFPSGPAGEERNL